MREVTEFGIEEARKIAGDVWDRLMETGDSVNMTFAQAILAAYRTGQRAELERLQGTLWANIGSFHEELDRRLKELEE